MDGRSAGSDLRLCMDHIADGSVWGALFTTDVLGEPDKFRAWAPGGAFADIPRHGRIEFTNDGAAFQLLNMDSNISGRRCRRSRRSALAGNGPHFGAIWPQYRAGRD